MFDINDDVATPPLPRAIGLGRQDPAAVQRRALAPGYWLMQYQPFFADDLDPNVADLPRLHGWTLRYLGPLRVETGASDDEQGGHHVRASGDLYVERQSWSQPGPVSPPPLPRPARLPVFPLRAYCFYLTLEDLAVGRAGKRELTFAAYRFESRNSSWGPAATLVAQLERPKPDTIPPAWRRAGEGHYLSGPVLHQGTRIGRLEMGRISHYLREAHIRSAAAPGLQMPRSNGKGATAPGIFRRLGWRLHLHPPTVAQGPAEVWQEKDLHAAMLALRATANFDREWVYHILVVPRFRQQEEQGFGKMYDGGALDTDLVPREGLVIAERAKFPDDPIYGAAAGQRLEDVPPADFFNLMHEIGHTMGLVHRFRNAGFMQALMRFATQPGDGAPFPEDLKFQYLRLDELRLRHHPDIWVRPGGAPFGAGFSDLPVPEVDVFTDVGEQIELAVRPLRRIVPLGAPVRIELRLTNRSTVPLPGPAKLSLAYGSVGGRVIAPAGEVRSFSAAAPLDHSGAAPLAPGQSLFHGETIWRGPDGALFAAPGVYRIEVEAEWVSPGGVAKTAAHCEVLIASPRRRDHARAATALLASPDVAVLLVFQASPAVAYEAGRERIRRAARLLRQASQIKELRPSLAAIVATREAGANLRRAAALVTRRTQMTTSEMEYLLTLVDQAAKRLRRSPPVQRLVGICERQLQRAVCRGFAPQSLLDLARRLGQCS